VPGFAQGIGGARSQNHHGSNLEAAKRVYVPPVIAVLLLEFATQTPHLNTPADKLWSFASGKNPEVNTQSGFTTGTPGKPGFLRSKKCAQIKFSNSIRYLLILYK
jgi:hypothetical protein